MRATTPTPPDPAEGGWEADPDVQLMLKARDGDHAAFRELFRRHSDSLINFVFRFMGNRDRAEELVQDAFLQIFRARARYEPRARFAPYLYRVATNLCLNELRRFEYQGKIDALEEPEADDEEPRGLADDRLPTAEEHVAGVETAERIQKVLDRLPPNQRSALLLSRVEGLSYQEVAESLDTSVSAVKSLIFRGTQALRDQLKDLLP